MANQAFRDYTGQKIGHLVILGRFGSKRYFPKNKSGRRKRVSTFAVWSYRCVCGKEGQITSNSLRTTRSCGCVRGPKDGYENGRAAKTKILNYYKYSAELRKLIWDLTEDQFIGLCMKDCHYCGAAPSKISVTKFGSFIYNGVDRKDNTRGYTLDNVLPCCEICNLAKRDLAYEDFISWLKRAARHQNQNGELQFQTI